MEFIVWDLNLGDHILPHGSRCLAEKQYIGTGFPIKGNIGKVDRIKKTFAISPEYL